MIMIQSSKLCYILLQNPSASASAPKITSKAKVNHKVSKFDDDTSDEDEVMASICGYTPFILCLNCVKTLSFILNLLMIPTD